MLSLLNISFKHTVDIFRFFLQFILEFPLVRDLNPKSVADDNLKFCRFFKNNKEGIILHENRLLADETHVISYLIFVENWGKCHKNCHLLQS